MNSSSVQRALSIKELLCELFSYSSASENATNGRVCKAWFDEALNYTWSAIEIRCLVSLLAPLKVSNGNFIFTRGIGVGDWARFDAYAWRVRKLTFSGRWEQSSVFAEIAITRPRIELLPNLTSLTFTTYVPYKTVTLFGHSAVQSLALPDTVLFVPENLEIENDSQSKLGYLSTRMPDLRALSIQYKYDEPRTVASLVQFLGPTLRDLPFLESLKIPDFWMTGTLIHHLALHPRLRCIKAFPTGRPFDLAIALPPSAVHFPSLDCLALTMSFNNATWLAQLHNTKGLTSLSLRYLRSTSLQDDWPPLLGIITSQFRSLEELSLASKHGWRTTPSAADLRAVCSLPRLRTFHLLSPYNLETDIDEASLVSIFRASPQLESFRIPHASAIRLSCINELAPIATNLEILELTWSASAVPIHALHRFPRLAHLCGYIDASTVNTEQVARFMSRVLPAECTVYFEPLDDSNPDWYMIDEFLSAFRDEVHG
ncbi:hypothetical protein PC9H_005760 [Pleurotus ostreatus]|uniref:F-box domain-containing protein n=1 Tax=Pleurotus ostreatus TaxID=5322 RepID=A0A8H7DVU2_PLEOS|nr:uncharacterized protein PC9H_005760 [Pleurotus ostreatus]KAF7433795.1 hypothetical protein PC9H_005760 [Pleurotus ostreatus]KAJ8697414.1 hypothetical protein PTI98_004223 [Pleurotus ostreatus]